jgi:hypothetical protein
MKTKTIIWAVIVLFAARSSIKGAEKPPQAPPVEMAAKIGCVNCTICGTGYTSGLPCPCFGGGYYCADGKCYIPPTRSLMGAKGAKPPQAPPVEHPAVRVAAPVVAAPVPFVQDRSTGIATAVQPAGGFKSNNQGTVRYGAPILIPAPVMGRSGITNCPPGES